MIYSLNEVLIVAKCLVNYEDCNGGIDWYEVLIVAKCIVNSFFTLYVSGIISGINSSKV